MKMTDYGQRSICGGRIGMDPCMGGADVSPAGERRNVCGCGMQRPVTGHSGKTGCGCTGQVPVRGGTGCGGSVGGGIGPVRGGFSGCAVSVSGTGRTVSRDGAVCGLGQHHDLLDEIRAVEFALCELVLYLDAYPDCGEALAMYHELLEQREALVCRYEQEVGPLTCLGCESKSCWTWVKGPFPWEYEAND